MRWLFATDFRIAPFFVLFDGVLLAGFVWLPYVLLVTSSMLIFNVTVSLFLASYVILKHRHPEKRWIYGLILLLSYIIWSAYFDARRLQARRGCLRRC